VVPKPRPEESKTAEAAKPVPDKVKPLGAGTLTALSVGNYMDDQEKDLRAKLHGSGVTVSRVGDNLVVNIRSDRLFDGNAQALSSQGDSIVQRVADSVRKFDSTTLLVNGFTDAAGAPQRDLKLSQMRADLVDKALIENGVDPHRVSAKGFGAGGQKISSARDERNRRVEIDITPRVKT
jgi:outer membrane protein OmpA-like peptidoglycan-associated protein